MIFCFSSAVTAPSSPKYSSYLGEFDLTDLDQLDIRSRNNSNGRYDIYPPSILFWLTYKLILILQQ